MKNSKIKDITVADFIPTDENTGLKLEDMRIFEIYLPNYHNMCYDKCNEIEKKLWLFECESFNEIKELKLNEEDKWIVKEMERLAMDNKFIDEYDAEKVNKILMNTKYEEGYDKGIAKGEKQNSIEIAKKMLEKGMSEDEIAELTQLSIEEIKKIYK